MDRLIKSKTLLPAKNASPAFCANCDIDQDIAYLAVPPSLGMCPIDNDFASPAFARFAPNR